MAAFSTLAMLGLGLLGAAKKGRDANAQATGGQTGAELLSGQGPTSAELAGVGATVPNTVLGQGTPTPPAPPDAGLAEYNAVTSARAAADKQRRKATGMAQAASGTPSVLGGTAVYTPKTLLGA